MGTIWAICSGSGGVGKTTLALALAAYAAEQGKKVILLDAAGVSRSCDLALGLENVMTLDASDVLSGQIDIKAVLYPVPKYKQMYLANASLCTDVVLSELSGVVLAMQSMCDILIVDLPTGQLMDSMGVMTKDDVWVFVTRPEDASIRSAELLMQRIRAHEANRLVVVNRSKKERIRRGLQYDAQAVSLTLDCPVIGVIPEEEHLSGCRLKGKTALECDAAVRHAIRNIASALLASN